GHLTSHRAHRARLFGSLDRRTEDRIGLALDLDTRALERLPRGRAVLDAYVDDPSPFESDARHPFDVDPRRTEGLADAGESTRFVVDRDHQIGRHRTSSRSW